MYKKDGIMKKLNRSIIYHDIFIYRLSMNLLYAFQYRKRFNQITRLFKPGDSRIVELCFGDIYVAEFCSKTGRSWTGYDLNESFVGYSRKKGYDAHLADIEKIEKFPQCDVCIMTGSLYHFNRNLPDLFKKIRKSSKRFLLSEPVKNLTHKKGLLQWLSGLLTNAGRGTEKFRYNEDSLIKAVEKIKSVIKFKYHIISKGRDMLLEVVW